MGPKQESFHRKPWMSQNISGTQSMSRGVVWATTHTVAQQDHYPDSTLACQLWSTIRQYRSPRMIITALRGNIADMIRAMKMINIYGKLKADER